MKNFPKYLLSALIGSAYGALPVVLSRLLIRTLSSLFHWIGCLAEFDARTLEYGAQILSPMRDAPIASPWIIFLAVGAAIGVLTSLLPPCRWKRLLLLLAGALLLLPLMCAALWLTSVHEIGVGHLIQSILPILPHLL